MTHPNLEKDAAPASPAPCQNPNCPTPELRGQCSRQDCPRPAPASPAPQFDESFGYSLAMRVLQSDLYRQLDDKERGECDELIRRGQAPASPAPCDRCEPIAWRYRYRPTALDNSWRYVTTQDECNPSDDYEKQPLYASCRHAPAPLAGLPEEPILGEPVDCSRLREQGMMYYPEDFNEILSYSRTLRAFAASRIGELEMHVTHWKELHTSMAITCGKQYGRATSAESAAAALRERLEATERDAARLDWLERNHTLHQEVSIWYVVDGYQVQIMHEDGATTLSPAYEGYDLRSAIDAALAAEGRKA